MLATSADKIWRWFEDARYFGVGSCLNCAWSHLLRSDATLAAPGYGRIRIRADQSDFAVVRQILRSREYDTSASVQDAWVQERYEDICATGGTPVIIDAGANIGVASIWFARRYPKAKVIAVEPDPENFTLCKANTQAFSNVVSVPAAIGAQPGVVAITNTTGGAWARQTQRMAPGEKGTPVRTIASLLNPSAGDRLLLVKIDIEGFERDLFSENLEWIEDAALIIIEPHDWMLPGQGSSANFQKAMARCDHEILVKGENLFYFKPPKASGGRTRRSGVRRGNEPRLSMAAIGHPFPEAFRAVPDAP